MERRDSGSFGVLVILLALGLFGGLLMLNARPTPELRMIVPTEAQPTDAVSGWARILEAGFGSGSTPLPTIGVPTRPFIIPTLALGVEGGFAPRSPIELGEERAVQRVFAATPTLPPPTSALLATPVPLTAIAVTRVPQQWQPPPLIPPLSRDALGRDHFYLHRPVDSNATNRGLFYYPYGSDGPDNNYRIHSGIDMPNPIGQTVRAAGSGVVVWAGPGFQETASYGNAVVIEHDFGHHGRRIYTLYAHLSAVLVLSGQPVAARDPIGLVGNTGRVSGPHVHFEVRLAQLNSSAIPGYGDTYNPMLWMAPYVGTGVIAGRLTDARGRMIQDADITVRSFATGLVIDTTTTYILPGTTVDMNRDPEWGENFVVGDVPVGRYEVIAVFDGVRVARSLAVLEGTTTFVELSPIPPTAVGG